MNVFIPLELQEMILDQLRLDSGQGLAERYEFYKKTLPSCSLVCKAWLKKCRVILFHSVEITSLRKLNRFYAMLSSPTSHRIGPHVEEVTIRDSDAHSPYIHLVLMKSARYFPNLHKILIYGEEAMSFPIFHHLHLYLFHFRRLEYLRIERYSIGFRDIRRVISSFPSLIEVEMMYVAFTTSPDAHYATLPLLKDTAWKLSTVKLRACSINYLGLHFWVAPSLSIRDRALLTSISPLSVYDVHVLTKLLETGYGRDVEQVAYERIPEPADDTLIVHCYSWFGGHYTFIFGHLNLPEQTSSSPHSQLKAIVRTFEIDNARYRNHDWSTVDALVSEIRSSHLSVNINVPRSVKYRKSQPQETREEEMEGIRLKLPWVHRHCNLNIQIPSKPGWHPPRLSELARSNSMSLVPLPTLPGSVHKTIIQFLRAPFDNATLAMCALTSKAWLMESRRIHFKVININERRSPESLRELLTRRETETISEHIVVLHLNGFPGFRINNMFFSIIPVLPNLRSIAILKDQYWEGQYIVFVPKYPFPTSQYRFRLRVLELRGYRIWFTDLRRLMNAYPSLESVRMEDMSISHRNNPLPPVRNSSRSVKTFQLMQSRPIIFPFWLWLSPALFEPNDNITNPDTQRFGKFNTPFLTMPDVFAITQLIRSGFRHARHGQAPSDSLTSMNSYRWEYDAVYGIWNLRLDRTDNNSYDPKPPYTNFQCLFSLPSSTKAKSNSTFASDDDSDTHRPHCAQLQAITILILAHYRVPYDKYAWTDLDDLLSRLDHFGMLRYVRIHIETGLRDIYWPTQPLEVHQYDNIRNQDARTIASLMPWTSKNCMLDLVIDGESISWNKVAEKMGTRSCVGWASVDALKSLDIGKRREVPHNIWTLFNANAMQDMKDIMYHGLGIVPLFS